MVHFHAQRPKTSTALCASVLFHEVRDGEAQDEHDRHKERVEGAELVYFVVRQLLLCVGEGFVEFTPGDSL
jgi:hypothetical protein